ncbi:MAG: molybdopterin-dependent oxidoreductase [Halobacteriota archaeon]
MSKHDTSNDGESDDSGLSIGRRGFMKTTAAGVAAAGLGGGLNSLVQAQDARTDLVEHTGEWRASACGGCTSWCASNVLVNDRTGHAIDTRGNPHSKVHGSNDCPRMDLTIQQMYDPDRIKQPMRRTNPNKGPDEDPEFEPISWDEAISEIADKIMELRENGETHKYMLARGRYTYLRPIIYSDMTKIIGSPNNISHSAICAEAEKFGPMYTEGEWSYRQYDVTETRYVIAWGADPIATNRQVSHYINKFGEMLDRADLAVVEPRLSASATKADEWMPVQPGQDGALATAIAHVLLTEGLWYKDFVGDFEDGVNRFEAGETVDPETFDESENVHGLVKWWNLEIKDRTPEWAEEQANVDAEQIRRVARKFGEAAPHAISWVGGGPVMQVRGGYNSMATHVLNGLVGSVGNRGGPFYAPPDGTQSLPSPDDFIDETAQEGLEYEKIDQRGRLEFPALKKGKSGGGVVTNNAADGILDEDPMEIEMLVSYWNNFAFSNPEPQRWEEALSKIPFHVTIETHGSETAWFANIVLPATHHMYERWGQWKSMGNARMTVNLLQPVLADDPNDPEDVVENGRLWDVKSAETEIPYMIADELADRGFTNLLEHYEQFVDPETGLAPSDEYDDLELRAQAFARNAIKHRMQPMWDPDLETPPGDEFTSWEDFREAGVWNSAKWDYRHRWPAEGGEFGTETGKFEFYGETLKKALEGHAEKHGTDVDTVLETCNYQARGEQAFIPHYEEPAMAGDENEFPFELVEHKSRLSREGRSANCTWFHEFKDVDPGAVKGEDVVKINPKDADDLGLENGDPVTISSPTGEIKATVNRWEGVRPGTVVKEYGQGHWAYGSVAADEYGVEPRGGNPNRLHPADFDRLSGSSVTYGDVRVNVERR